MSFLSRILRWLFAPYHIDKIAVAREVIINIAEAARTNHPKEFIAVLTGSVRLGTLTIDGLAYQRYEANHESAWVHLDIPLTTHSYGTIHSHPGKSNHPSDADIRLFNKTGMVHAIICMPYEQENIAFYDKYGEQVYVEIRE